MPGIELVPAKTAMRAKLPRNKISYQTIRGARAWGVPDHEQPQHEKQIHLTHKMFQA